MSMTEAELAAWRRRMSREGHDEKCLACMDPERWYHDLVDPPGSKPRRLVRVYAP